MLGRSTRRTGYQPAACRQALALISLAGAVVLVAGCSMPGGRSDPADGAADAASQASPVPGTAVPSSTSLAGPGGGSAAAPGSPASGAPVVPAGLTRADLQAGVLSPKVSTAGTGTLVTVRGDVAAPSSRGRLVRVKVQVEKGLPIDARRFASFALLTLNDPRSWGHGGTRRFARTDGSDYDVRLILASPDTSARLCRPLVTYGKLSCHAGDATVLTVYRWVKAIPGYGTDRTGYREYVVNHEVGHALGHGHEYCPGAGKLAPVMMQQTKGLGGCRPNPWPYP